MRDGDTARRKHSSSPAELETVLPLDEASRNTRSGQRSKSLLL